MKLIGSLTSPYVRKARIVFAEKKIEVPLIQENVWSQDTTIMQANPLGKVPCLVMDDGGAMFDSRVSSPMRERNPRAASVGVSPASRKAV